MKTSTWFDALMLALILLASLAYVALNDPDTRRLSAGPENASQSAPQAGASGS